MNIDDIRNKLDTVGNVKVIFEPSNYNANRIQKRDLQETLEKSVVSLRGWSFPLLPIYDKDGSRRPYSIGNGIEFFTDWDKFTEMFRFHQSGQFLARFALFEDTIGEVRGEKIEPGKYLDFLSLIYKTTEIVLFIKNLIENTDIESGQLSFEISKTRDRELESIFSQNILGFHGGYICGMPEISTQVNFSREEIFNDPLSVARNVIKNIFDDFNWRTYSEGMIQTHQENLVNRRI